MAAMVDFSCGRISSNSTLHGIYDENVCQPFSNGYSSTFDLLCTMVNLTCETLIFAIFSGLLHYCIRLLQLQKLRM